MGDEHPAYAPVGAWPGLPLLYLDILNSNCSPQDVLARFNLFDCIIFGSVCRPLSLCKDKGKGVLHYLVLLT